MVVPIATVVGYALVDAVNPCVLAMLAMLLIVILTRHPENKKKVLYAGFSFIAAIFMTYFFYGVIIIQLLQGVNEIFASTSIYLYAIFGLGAIVLGLLNIKDYLRYKPGQLATEMPISWRPRVKKLIETASSAKGAFLVGIFVTLFLLPCTIGPYIITGGILAQLTILETIPWLILYNIIFAIPMIAITLGIYIGYMTVESTANWKDLNIKKLHLVSGIVMIILGVYLFLSAITGAV